MEKQESDPTMIHPAVLLYRNTFRLNVAPGWRQDIIAEVSPDGEEGLALWKDILDHWKWFNAKKGKWIAKNKFDIRAMLQTYCLRREDEL